ncbi:DUF4214 domain-containing protein [Halomonas sp. 7T]|uniref:beta strand repeat-containing protein n=1 Tax=Halomonas sp. 7T TaxID=2893469 RepID=UPI0021D99087|nr:DUF4214 domain-containing protein [Halomonas sp. 7T]UXZ55066.1 DUF4214 domain-containing protein [Halomonas sp. 7T]
MALTKTQVSELYVAIFNRASEGEGNAYWQGLGLSSAQAADAMLATTDAQEYFGDTLNDDQAFVELIYANTLNKTPEDDAEGIAYWTGLLESGLSRGEMVAALVAAVADYADSEDPATLQAFQQFNNRVAVSNYTADNLETVPADYATSLNFGADLTVTADSATVINAQTAVDALVEAQPEPPIDPGVDGETFILTDGRDNITGTDDNDTFIGTVGQNQNGAVSNAFATGDVLDGGAGRDKIEATMINDNEVEGLTNTAPRPVTKNIEEVYIEALENVTLDATRMENVEQYWADFGRGNMTFENVSLQGDNLSITKDVTFGIRDTQFDTNFTAEFDSQSLIREAASQVNSSLLVRIADVSTETPTTPLANVDLNLSFNLGGETVTLEGVRSTDGTYPGLALALRNALEEAGYGDINVNLSTPYDQVTVGQNTVNLDFTAQEILLTDPAGNEFSNVNFTQAAIQPVADGFLVAGNAQPQDPSSTSSLIESNLVLDNAGRGSIAGDVNIGGGSNSDLGVEQFNVLVDRSSKIESLNTTNDKLQNIVISSIGAAGSLYIGATQADLTEIDANAFEGAELSLGEGTVVSDLVNLDAGGTSADVTFVADYDGAGRASDAQSFVINTGSGSDTITADLTGTSTSGSTQASLTINAGAGNNVITLTSTDDEVNEATVVTAGGADTVTGGATHLTAETGAGADTIYAENTGFKAILEIDASAGQLVAAGDAQDVQFLFGKQIQVTLETDGVVGGADGLVDGFESGLIDIVDSTSARLTTVEDLNNAILKAINEDPKLSKIATASVDSNNVVTVQYLVDGLQVEAGVEVKFFGSNWADLTGTQQTAIQNAYWEQEQDSTINVAARYNAAVNVVAGSETVIDSADANAFSSITVGGVFAAGETISITVDGTTYNVETVTDEATTASNIAATLNANGITAEVDSGTPAQVNIATTSTVTTTVGDLATTTATVAAQSSLGTDSGTVGVNTVNAGAGDDVIVLSSNDGTNDTVEFDAGGFGNDTIVHFEDGATGDVLDFSAWLNNTVDASTGNSNNLSEQRVAGTIDAITAIGENGVAITDFTVLSGAATGTVEFESLTGAQVLTALNNGGTFGSAAASANLVQNELKSILMVENVDNLGEYKVFEVTSGTTAADDNFTGATLVGTVDFGETQVFNDANIA